MSYQQRILRDNPVGFWALDNSSFPADSSNGIFINGTRTLNNAIIGSSVVHTGISPLVCGGDQAASLSGSSSNSKITISNQYNMFLKTTESKSFTIEFWMSIESFNKNSSDKYKLPILSMNNEFTLYFMDNILTLEISDIVNETTKYLYLEAEDLDPQIYVCMTYSNKVYSLSINGNNKSSITMPNNYKFSNTTKQDFVFSTYGQASTNKIIIDSIAFYNYELNITQKMDHMIWALSDKNAQAWTIANNGGYIDISDTQGTVLNHTIFSSDEEWKLGKFKNCYVDNGALVVKSIPSLAKYSISSALDVSLDLTNGLVVTNDSSLKMDSFDSYCNLSSDIFSIDVKASGQCSFLSIDGLSIGKLILRYNSDSKIELYSPDNNAISLKSNTVSTGTWKNVSIYVSQGVLYMNVAGNISSYILPSGYLSGTMTLYLGNSYIVDSNGITTSSPLTGGLKNFKVTHVDGTWFNAELLNDYNIAQYSEWIAQVIPSSSDNIVGSRIHYGSASHNVSYFISLDNSSWTQIDENGMQIPLINLNEPQPVFYVKIVINTPDSSNNRPNVDFIEFVTYKSLYMDSRGFTFNLKPNTSNNNHSYTIRPNEFNVLSRDTNIGIYFETGTNPGNGILTPYSTFDAVEFWFKVHSDPSPNGNYYIADITSSTNASLYYDQDMKLNLDGNSWSAGYLNGVQITSTPTLIVDEIYHFVGVLGTAVSNPIKLNIKKNDTNPGNTSIGLISLYSSTPFSSAADALSQYKRYLGINQYSQSDTTTMSITESANIYATNWSIIPGAVV